MFPTARGYRNELRRNTLQFIKTSSARFFKIRFSHITPLLIKLHWLNVRSRISFKIILITYKVLYGKAPESWYLRFNIFETYFGLWTSFQQQTFTWEYCQKEHWPHLETEPSRLLLLSYGIVYLELRSIRKLTTFKKKPKTYHFKFYYCN